MLFVGRVCWIVYCVASSALMLLAQRLIYDPPTTYSSLSVDQTSRWICCATTCVINDRASCIVKLLAYVVGCDCCHHEASHAESGWESPTK